MALSEPRPGLKTTYSHYVTMARNIPRGSHQDLEKLIRGEESPYMLPGGTFVGLLFQNTCVLSSLLAGIHITATRFSKIKDYLMTDNTVGAVITFLDNKMYNEAMGLWLINLDLRVGRKQYFSQNGYLDCRGYVEDFLPNFDDLTNVKYEDDNNDCDMSPSARIYNGTLSNFKVYGYVYILDTVIDPKLILVNMLGRMGNGSIPPYVITDDFSRKYELQFLLLGLITAEMNHMVVCVKLEGGRWMLYDNSGTPQFQDFNMDIEMKKYVVYLAAYVNLNSAYPEKQVQESEQVNDLLLPVVVTVNNRRATSPFRQPVEETTIHPLPTCQQQ
ncbi:uncharacterized protein LOC129825156 isoform X1 [Salvelinus fontinalis]|uniref:uncharacterized protein LOC129825156 isoform X1 n=2 Tax=Salvelinus fontinalis TaxID=8038 RepID=UPI002486C524|nr:uncharacterized protein LOC129825156 isoform X1 [Salvelinus fontinalis]XP_055740992.1 uncharacterized protein LOC129825156 isoform X1 [Salvelinus fontinalis]